MTIKRLKRILKRSLVNAKCAMYYRIFGLLPIKKNKIVFRRHNGLAFGDHEKYIALKLIELGADCDMVWLVNDMDAEFPKEIRKVKNTDLHRIYELATAGVWLENCAKHRGTRKRKGQFYINTTHGVGISMKKFCLDDRAEGKLSRKNLIHDGEIADVVLSGGKFITEVYKTAFRIKGQVLETGSARVDILLNHTPDDVIKVKDKLGIEKDCRLVLYAPTFRRKGNEDFHCYNLDKAALLNALEQKFGGKWMLLVRLHPHEKKAMDTDTFPDNVLDVSDYDDIQELLIVSDVLVTDYSSVMFDFSFMKRPIFLFVNDLKEYLEQERDLYIRPDELPFSMAATDEELHKNIYAYEEQQYKEEVERFHQKCGTVEDGKASERVARLIMEKIQ